ncbi:DUF255 domain-containing protein [Streptomyces jumonjinensis]|uniref:DUF255 domain-containing protein n=1 Tax=Streptomyces jumonjinensis TaxID=1945 RepID=A0A646KAI2_STRJU|nr:DUF255 domain-containing protein [Streptomyces jumonjinensis]
MIVSGSSIAVVNCSPCGGRQRAVPVLLSVGYSSCHWCQ